MNDSTNYENTSDTTLSNAKHSLGLFIFRRDLRVVDNLGLHLCVHQCTKVMPIFIFTPEQVGNENAYKSTNAVQFMIRSLQDLHDQLKQSGGEGLHTFYGDNVRVLTHLIKFYNITYIAFNADYTPYAIKRDKEIIELCANMGISVEVSYDYYLQNPSAVLNGTNQVYQKFTPYYNQAIQHNVQEPLRKRTIQTYYFAKPSVKSTKYTITLEEALDRFTTINPFILVEGGRKEGMKCLVRALQTQLTYNKTHNMLDKRTTQLSAYIKFGCVSIREVYKAFAHRFGKNCGLIRQLYWRDFYANILRAHPQVYGSALKPSYNRIKWHNNNAFFERWKEGTTGFPIVDAGMRELNATGYMHNRARLIVATFLIKTLLIDWKKGEQYFAQKLTDYDPASNNGNWQWCAGTGADSQPYFRIFNPWEQAIHYDPDATYIKQWVPELSTLYPKAIHTWYAYCKYPEYAKIEYRAPIVDYKEQKVKALLMYKSVFE